MDLLGVFGAALWIVSMSLQASASRAAARRVPAGTPMPLSFGARPLRAPRLLALCLFPGLTFALGAALLTIGRDAPAWSAEALILFGARATGFALLALAHLRWLSAALERLGRDGALKS